MVSPSWVTDPDLYFAKLTLNELTRNAQSTSTTRRLSRFRTLASNDFSICTEKQFLYS
jgi:hypothetical protein